MALETVARELVLPTNANGHFKENGIEIENVSNELSVADTKKQNQQKLNQSEQKQIENTESKQSNSKIKINSSIPQIPPYQISVFLCYD